MTSAVASSVLAYIPSPDRGVWYLGPVPIRAYALCIIAGIIIAVVWGERRLVARGGAPGTVTDVAVFAVPFGLVGGRLYHVATDWPTYFGPGGDPIRALEIWEGGLGIWGAIALGGVGAWIGCRRRGVPLPLFADAVAPGIIVAQAVGRLGNYFNQELYGAPTELPWGLEIYRRVDPGTGLADPLGGVAIDHTPVEIVHPTFLYELILNLLVACLVVWADRRFRLGHGRAFAVYVAGYTLGRFFIEQMRTDQATRVFGDIRINVVVSAVVFIGAVAYIALAPRGREELPRPETEDEPTPVAVAPGPDLRKTGLDRPGGGARSAPKVAGAEAATTVLEAEQPTTYLERERDEEPADEPAPQEERTEVVARGSTGSLFRAVEQDTDILKVEKPEAGADEKPTEKLAVPAPAAKAEPAAERVTEEVAPVGTGKAAEPAAPGKPVEPAGEKPAEAATEKVAEPATAEKAPEPATAEKAAEPAAEKVAEPATEKAAEPATAEKAPEPAAERVAEPAAEKVAEPATEKVAQPAAENAAEPATAEKAAQPAPTENVAAPAPAEKVAAEPAHPAATGSTAAPAGSAGVAAAEQSPARGEEAPASGDAEDEPADRRVGTEQRED